MIYSEMLAILKAIENTLCEKLHIVLVAYNVCIVAITLAALLTHQSHIDEKSEGMEFSLKPCSLLKAQHAGCQSYERNSKIYNIVKEKHFTELTNLDCTFV